MQNTCSACWDKYLTWKTLQCVVALTDRAFFYDLECDAPDADLEDYLFFCFVHLLQDSTSGRLLQL